MYLLKCVHLDSGVVVGPYDFTHPVAALDCAVTLFKDNLAYGHRVLITIKGHNPGVDMDVMLDTSARLLEQSSNQQRNTP